MPPAAEESEQALVQEDAIMEEIEPTTEIQEDGGEEEQGISVLSMLKADPPPDAIENGWVMHRSRSFRGHVYYFNQFTSECRWDLPFVPTAQSLVAQVETTLKTLNERQQQGQQTTNDGDEDENATSQQDSEKDSNRSILKSALKKSSNTSDKADRKGADDETTTSTSHHSTTTSSSSSSSRHGKRSRHSSSSSSKKHRKDHHTDKNPEKVRVLHILKKHKRSRRPASWRNPKITISQEEATAELEELLAILQESAHDPKELRATFEELAKTESDCSSAKRGGDVGFFERKQMQPAFEKTSFAMKIGDLSGIIETKSGVHIILRLG